MMLKHLIYFCGTISLLAFYIHVGQLALNPDVSLSYRLYFIDRKLKNWHGHDGIRYQYGAKVDFAGEVPFLSRNGWYQADDGATWSDGKTAELFFQVDATRPPSLMIVTGVPFFPVGKDMERSEVTIYVNDKAVGSQSFDSPGSAQFSVSLLETQFVPYPGLLVVRLVCSQTDTPGGRGSSKDDHLPGFRFQQLIIQ